MSIRPHFQASNKLIVGHPTTQIVREAEAEAEDVLLHHLEVISLHSIDTHLLRRTEGPPPMNWPKASPKLRAEVENRTVVVVVGEVAYIIRPIGLLDRHQMNLLSQTFPGIHPC